METAKSPAAMPPYRPMTAAMSMTSARSQGKFADTLLISAFPLARIAYGVPDFIGGSVLKAARRRALRGAVHSRQNPRGNSRTWPQPARQPPLPRLHRCQPKAGARLLPVLILLFFFSLSFSFSFSFSLWPLEAKHPFLGLFQSLDRTAARSLVVAANVTGTRIRRAADRRGAAQHQAGGPSRGPAAATDAAAVLVSQRCARAAARLAGRPRPAPTYGSAYGFPHRRRPGAARVAQGRAGPARSPRGPRGADPGRSAAGSTDRTHCLWRAGRGRARDVRPRTGKVSRRAA